MLKDSKDRTGRHDTDVSPLSNDAVEPDHSLSRHSDQGRQGQHEADELSDLFKSGGPLKAPAGLVDRIVMRAFQEDVAASKTASESDASTETCSEMISDEHEATADGQSFSESFVQKHRARS